MQPRRQSTALRSTHEKYARGLRGSGPALGTTRAPMVALGDIGLSGKAVAQLGCNNGREIISCAKAGVFIKKTFPRRHDDVGQVSLPGESERFVCVHRRCQPNRATESFVVFTIGRSHPAESSVINERGGQVRHEIRVRAADVDLAFLARQFKLAGGNIRNVALLAAFLAAEDGTPIGMAQLMRAIRREYQKIGKLVTEAAGFVPMEERPESIARDRMDGHCFVESRIDACRGRLFAETKSESHHCRG